MTADTKSAVLITGASTGIGRETALRLNAMGYSVYAGVRAEKDGDDLRERSENKITPLILDVTKAEQIASSVKAIDDAVGNAGLAGLVNNAGVAVAGPLEFMPMDDLRRQFEINVFGLVAVTQACIPLLRKAKDRIVNISSIAGLSATPFVGPYCASKHAVEAITDALRMELQPWDIRIAAIEPGAIKTPIWEKGTKAADDMTTNMPANLMELYGDSIRGMRRMAEQYAGKSLSPSAVADAIVHALTSPNPRPRYLVGNDAKMRMWIERLPTSWKDSLILKRLKG